MAGPGQSQRGEFDVQLKLLLIGDSAVGKTSLLQRYTDDKFTSSFISTIGIDFKVKTIELEGKRVRLQVWDTAGQERFRTITTSYFRGSHGIGLCFDMSDRKSFVSLSAWAEQIASNADEGVPLALIATKVDLPPAVSEEEARAVAGKHSAPLYLTSAKENRGVSEAFTGLAGTALARYLASQPATHGAASGTVKVGAKEEGKTGGKAGCTC